MMKRHKTRLIRDERGIASILVTMIMMIVISLLVLGFISVANHEQTQSLDRELSTAAYYAAESGVNDVASFISQNATKLLVIGQIDKQECAAPNPNNGQNIWYTQFYLQDQQQLSTATNGTESNTCILVDTTPATLSKQFTYAGESWITPLYTHEGDIPYQFTFTESLPNGSSTDPANCTTTPSSPATTPNRYQFKDNATGDGIGCSFGVLRFDLVPVGHADANAAPAMQEPPVLANTLYQNTMTGFLVPNISVTPGSGAVDFVSNSANGSASSAQNNNDDVYPMSCSSTACTETITVQVPPFSNTATCDTTPPYAAPCNISLGGDSGNGDNDYYLRATMLYNTGTLKISAINTGAINNPGRQGNIVYFRYAQVLVDSTARVQNEEKRIQVTLPFSSVISGTAPDYAAQSTQNLCKLFTIIPPTGTPNSTNEPNPDASCPLN